MPFLPLLFLQPKRGGQFYSAQALQFYDMLGIHKERIDRHGFAKFKHWRFYGERGLAGEDVSVWVYEGNLKVEYQATALSLYELSIEKDSGEIAKVTNARRLETHFRSPQLDLWQLSDTEWRLSLRRPEPVAR